MMNLHVAIYIVIWCMWAAKGTFIVEYVHSSAQAGVTTKCGLS
jgi:hypothetical protein